jgi:hypothetical protein
MIEEDLERLWKQVILVREEAKKLESICNDFFGIYISEYGPWKNPKHRDYEKYHSSGETVK